MPVEVGLAPVQLGLAGDELFLAALDLGQARLHLLNLGARGRELALELLRLGTDRVVTLVHLGLAPSQRGILGGDARAFLRETLLGVGEPGLAPGEILLAALELVLARLPLTLAGREVALGLVQLLFARRNRRAALSKLRGAPARESLGLRQLGVARVELLLELGGSRLGCCNLVLER